MTLELSGGGCNHSLSPGHPSTPRSCLHPCHCICFSEFPTVTTPCYRALLWLPGTSGCMTAGIMRLYREQCYNPPWTVTSVLTQRNIPLAGRMSTECRNQKHFSSQYPHYNFGIIIIIMIYKTSWGDSSVVKIICCSSRGSEFCSENPLLTTPNCLEFYLQVEAFSALCWQWHTHSIYSIRYAQKLHLFKITIIYYFASFAIEICGGFSCTVE